MTANQISAAVAREDMRHNRAMEDIDRERNDIQDRYNKAVALINAADQLNDVTKALYEGQAVNNQALANEREYYTNQQKVAIEQLKVAESNRHNKAQERLSLRSIKANEYDLFLKAKMNQFTREQALWDRQQRFNEWQTESRRVTGQINYWTGVINDMTMQRQLDMLRAQTDIANLQTRNMEAWMNYQLNQDKLDVEAGRAKFENAERASKTAKNYADILIDALDAITPF